jgi:hypothetical protein
MSEVPLYPRGGGALPASTSNITCWKRERGRESERERASEREREREREREQERERASERERLCV